MSIICSAPYIHYIQSLKRWKYIYICIYFHLFIYIYMFCFSLFRESVVNFCSRCFFWKFKILAINIFKWLQTEFLILNNKVIHCLKVFIQIHVFVLVVKKKVKFILFVTRKSITFPSIRKCFLFKTVLIFVFMDLNKHWKGKK